ncbi:MAG: PAS domain-containing protein [Thalassotalea sp.]|nr:PAS domain-containing protein [Thalassotalea sp.]
MHKSIPTEILDNSPVPILVVELTEDSLNHAIIYSNKAFIDSIGWSLEEIPDKNHWWKKAYPDPSYQKVVENLWELSMESADLKNDSYVTITVNIMTKFNGVKRFNVHTELQSTLKDGYYVVKFEEITQLND